MLLCSFADWKWRMPHQSYPFCPHLLLHQVNIFNTKLNRLVAQLPTWSRIWSGFLSPSAGHEETCSCCLDVYNTNLAGQQHCVILSFYSCDPGVSLVLCVVCPTWSFLSHCMCCIPTPWRKHPVGSGHLLLLLTFREVKCGWTHIDPIIHIPLSESFCL